MRKGLIGAFLFAATAGLLLPGCRHTASTMVSQEENFKAASREFARTHYEARPLAGVSLGMHQYDGKFVVRTQSMLDSEIARLKTYQKSFGSISPSALSEKSRFELDLIKSTIDYELWVHEKQRPYWRNPMAYSGDAWNAMDVSAYLVRDFKPLPERFRDMAAVLRKAPESLLHARRNLEKVLPREFVELSIESANGTASFLENDVAKAAAGLNAADKAAFDAAMKPAAAAFKEFAEWLKQERMPQADHSFALGRASYMEMLRAEFVTLTPEEILARGLQEIKAEQERFRRAAADIDPKLTPQEAATLLQREHPTAEGLIPDTRKNLETIRQYLVDHDIITIPSEERAQVQETLPPFRATTFASMLTPGPFETKKLPAYYYVTPVEADWTEKQKEEWLGAFNYYTLDVVSIHEAYPGHYVQFLKWNASPLSDAQKLFPGGYYGAGSYAFVEGWAHYAEQMMLEEGFGQPKNPATATREEVLKGAKYRLGQSTEALLRLCRLVCSVKLHCENISVDEATKFIMQNAYYEEKPAHSEAMRGTADPGYLYYSLGKLMILKLREDWKAQEGSAYSLKRFHDELLSHGSPPLPLLRRLMLKDEKKWAEVL
jgi:uncharacterized protein (DUF885 family)